MHFDPLYKPRFSLVHAVHKALERGEPGTSIRLKVRSDHINSKAEGSLYESLSQALPMQSQNCSKADMPQLSFAKDGRRAKTQLVDGGVLVSGSGLS